MNAVELEEDGHESICDHISLSSVSVSRKKSKKRIEVRLRFEKGMV